LSDEKKDTKVKVIDRRWIDADGTPKDPLPSRPAEPAVAEAPGVRETPPPSPQPIAAPIGADEPASGATNGPTQQVGFLDLVDFLAQQAVALMSGQVPGRGRDPATARFFIDLLGVLQEKTAGKLGREEASYLEDVLYQLRSLFLAATR
jgi:hypothetical protein